MSTKRSNGDQEIKEQSYKVEYTFGGWQRHHSLTPWVKYKFLPRDAYA